MLNKFVSIGDSFSKHMDYEAFVGSSGIVIEQRDSYSRVQIVSPNDPSMMFKEVDIHNQDIVYQPSRSSKYHTAFVYPKTFISYEDSTIFSEECVNSFKAAFYITTNQDMMDDFYSYVSENYSSYSLGTRCLFHIHRFKRMYDHDLLYSEDMFSFMKESVYKFIHFLSKDEDIQSTQDIPIIHLDDSKTYLAKEFFKHHGPYSAIQYSKIDTVTE